jgi:hypothetical protein
MGLVISTSFAKAHGITAATPPATVAKDLIGSTGGLTAPVLSKTNSLITWLPSGQEQTVRAGRFVLH